MNLPVSGFDWDEGNRWKCEKHGASIAEVEALFVGGPLVAPNPRHSFEEDRFIAVGRTRTNKAIFVAFTLRSKSQGLLIRPISARYMHREEIAAYDKKNP